MYEANDKENDRQRASQSVSERMRKEMSYVLGNVLCSIHTMWNKNNRIYLAAVQPAWTFAFKKGKKEEYKEPAHNHVFSGKPYLYLLYSHFSVSLNLSRCRTQLTHSQCMCNCIFILFSFHFARHAIV